MGSFAVTFWPVHFLGQGKLAFGNFFVWIVSVLMRIQKIIKMTHIVEKKGKRKVQGVPQSQTAALPRHHEEEESSCGHGT